MSGTAVLHNMSPLAIVHGSDGMGMTGSAMSSNSDDVDFVLTKGRQACL